VLDAVQRREALIPMRYEECPQLTPTKIKAINKLYDVGPGGFGNGISTKKYANLCRVPRATAYRELTALCEMGVLVQTGVGRGAWYKPEERLLEKMV
jgi:Fic family protein